MQNNPYIKIHKFWWFWLPFGLLVMQSILDNTMSREFLVAMNSEKGPYEFAHILLMVAGFFVAISTLRYLSPSKDKVLFGWISLAALCCFYVAGEEASWGQHIGQWATPEYWSDFNDQNETNLHNVSSWLDQKPRLLLELGIIIGGIFVPLIRRFKPSMLPQKFALILPQNNMIIIAICAEFVRIPERIIDVLDLDVGFHIFERSSELQEFFFFYFVLIYLLILKRKIRQA